VGGWRYVRENSLSKYYNHIDFELAFDDSERPVDMFANPPLEAARFDSFYRLINTLDWWYLQVVYVINFFLV